MSKIFVLGLGPGNPDYILPVVLQKAAACQVLVGGKRQLDIFRPHDKEEIILSAALEKTIERIKAIYQNRRVGVLVSGDPGYYSLLGVLLKHFRREDLEVFPGISSVQYLFAKAALPWQEALLVSLHGRRNEDLLRLVKENNTAAFLTDPYFPVGEIASFLIGQGIQGKRALVGEDLSYPHERIRDMALEEWCGQQVSKLSVMVIYNG